MVTDITAMESGTNNRSMLVAEDKPNFCIVQYLEETTRTYKCKDNSKVHFPVVAFLLCIDAEEACYCR